MTMPHEAMYWKKTKGSTVQCKLCRWHCVIGDKKWGNCGIRQNLGGKLYAMTYGQAFSPSVDPIEKKPFYHFWPGSSTLSFCTVGCNFHCLHCCNAELSQGRPDSMPFVELSPAAMVKLATENQVEGISYTYTEPTVFYEYAHDTGVLAKKKGLYNAFVTNGYAESQVIKDAAKDFLTAARIDLKGDAEHYKKVCGGIKLDGVLDTIKAYYKTGMHIEIITLVIPGDNDSREMVDWMADFIGSLSKDVPWHFIRFFPTYKMMDTPVTDARSLERMHGWAKEKGMNYVYSGNVPGHKYDNTYCPRCGELVIERQGFGVVRSNLKGKPGKYTCSKGHKIPIEGPVKLSRGIAPYE